jgi:hypothetical protein
VTLTIFFSTNGTLREVKGTEEEGEELHVGFTRHCGKSPVTTSTVPLTRDRNARPKPNPMVVIFTSQPHPRADPFEPLEVVKPRAPRFDDE